MKVSSTGPQVSPADPQETERADSDLMQYESHWDGFTSAATVERPEQSNMHPGALAALREPSAVDWPRRMPRELLEAPIAPQPADASRSSTRPELTPDVRTRVPVARGELDTHVYLSDADEVHGTLLIRTPYLALDPYGYIVTDWLERDFNVVVQSIIGTGESSGDFEYLSTEEIDDAAATLGWLSTQPFSNGAVVLYGESYDGFLALAGGLTRHPSVSAVVAASAPTDPRQDSFTSGGMVEYALLKYYLDLSSSQRMSTRDFERRVTDLFERDVPLEDYDDSFRADGIDDWDQLVQESLNLEFVERGVYDRLGEIEVPVLLMAGEHRDQDATDAIHAFRERQRNHDDSGHSCPTRLAVGPWLHGNQIVLSQRVASQFVDAVLANRLQCEFPHQVDYIADHEAPIRVGSELDPEIFSRFSTSIGREGLEFGVGYDADSVDANGGILLPRISEPWTHVSPGLERPFIRIPIEENMRLAGPVRARISLLGQTNAATGVSMEILVGRAAGGWSSLDESYNMYRTRRLVREQRGEIVEVELQSPYLSLDLNAGDELVLSFQRSHDAITANRDESQDIMWLLNDDHPLDVNFLFGPAGDMNRSE